MKKYIIVYDAYDEASDNGSWIENCIIGCLFDDWKEAYSREWEMKQNLSATGQPYYANIRIIAVEI